MNERRVVGGLYGFFAVAVAIWLNAEYGQLVAQVFILTAFAIVAPVGMAAVTKGFRRLWFPIAFVVCLGVHAALVFAIRSSLPLHSMLAAILLASLETVGLALVSVNIRSWYEA